MTDTEKAVAELSNNKIFGSVFLILAYVPLLRSLASEEDYSKMYDEFSLVTSGCAEYAATHAAWRHKRTYLAGRPAAVICHLANTNSEFASAHPEAKYFEPMIPVGDHPEYPSGSSAIYTAFAQAVDDWFLDKFNLTDALKSTGPLTFTVPHPSSTGLMAPLKMSLWNTKNWMNGLKNSPWAASMVVFTLWMLGLPVWP